MEEKQQELLNEIGNKLDADAMQADLEKKADTEALDFLRQGVEKVNSLVEQFYNSFADKA